MTTLSEERRTAIHLLRAGHPIKDVAQQLSRTPRWVRKWHKQFKEEGWLGLEDQSRAPRTHGTRLPDSVRQAIALARSELEAEAAQGKDLKYIGAIAVRTRLKEKQVSPLPSVSSIERVLREKKMTRAYHSQASPEPQYPHLTPTEPQQLIQVDIVPHFLTGGEHVSCFNAIDVVSRYPTGQAYLQRRAEDAVSFLIHVWQTIGLPDYTQVDNEGCFSGGFTHPYVIGKVARTALFVGTELVFSPLYHPKSNGFVERFHQDYNRHVWEGTYLDSRHTVQIQSDHFFSLYRNSRHHSALHEQTPSELHAKIAPRLLPAGLCFPSGRLPLYEGSLHFMRHIEPNSTIPVVNVDWHVPDAAPGTGVWATIDFRCTGATLSVYDDMPQAKNRRCLITHPFPLSEPVLARPSAGYTMPSAHEPASPVLEQETEVALPETPLLMEPMDAGHQSQRILPLLIATLKRAACSATELIRGTMY
jgi:putative transposase